MVTIKKTNHQTVTLSVKVEQELKEQLGDMALKRGMDLSKLARVVLTNYVKPGSYQVTS